MVWLWVAGVIAMPVVAQRHVIYNQRIASLQVVAGQRWQEMPVAQLGEPVHIDFDDMTHDYERYSYKIEHCEADWSESREIFTSDFLQGFNGELTIDNYEQSLNTNHLYTHYSLTIPNEHCRLTMSGNYKLSVFADDDDSHPVFTACFMLVDPQMKVSMSVTGNTDIDIYHSHQQVAMAIDYGEVRVTDPARQLKTIVLQNGRWDNAVTAPRAEYVNTEGLSWKHCRQLIFNGGNEYHKFEMLDLSHTTMGLDSIFWDGSEAHAYVMANLPRPNYVYDESANGAFYIRNSDNIENDRISEYVNVMFRLKAPRQHGDVYVNGVWTNGEFTPKYEMTYNEIAQQYEAIIKLKQGYYSYQYLTKRDDGSIVPVSSEGNFFQTENEYQAFVYWRPIGERTDRLVGYSSVRTK